MLYFGRLSYVTYIVGNSIDTVYSLQVSDLSSPRSFGTLASFPFTPTILVMCLSTYFYCYRLFFSLKTFLVSSYKIAPEQTGLVKGKATREQILKVRQIIEKAMVFNKPI